MDEMKRILFLTSNEGKLREAKHALEPKDTRLFLSQEAPVKCNSVELSRR